MFCLFRTCARSIAAQNGGRLINGYGPTEGTTFSDLLLGDQPERFSRFRSDRPTHLEHAGLRSGRWFGACTCRGERGALHRGFGTGAGLCGASGSDGGTVCCGPVRSGGEPDVPHRGPGALAGRRGAGVPGACGCAGEGARLPHRAGRDRGGAGSPCGCCAGGGDRARGRPRRQAAGRRGAHPQADHRDVQHSRSGRAA